MCGTTQWLCKSTSISTLGEGARKLAFLLPACLVAEPAASTVALRLPAAVEKDRRARVY